MVDAPEARHLIQNCKFAYCYGLDDGDVERVLSAFTPDAEYEIVGETRPDNQRAEGRAEIRDVVEHVLDLDVEAMTHVATNPHLEIGDEAARGRWFYTVFFEEADGTFEVAIGEYRDEYRLTDDSWKMARCRVIRRHSTQW